LISYPIGNKEEKPNKLPLGGSLAMLFVVSIMGIVLINVLEVDLKSPIRVGVIHVSIAHTQPVLSWDAV
jgi:hypothetical protein